MNISEVQFTVLASLAGGPKHGYGILLDVRKLSAGRVQPQVPTLYRVLDRLAADGLVAESGSEVVGGRFRRYYRLTDDGAVALDAAVSLRAMTTSVARRRLRQRVATTVELGAAP